jgi:WD40 repeat protein
MFVISLPIRADYDACIKPRNSFSQNTISDIQWSINDSMLYVATMGTIWKISLDHSSLEPLHQICVGRFPVIEISETYYAVGSDFLPRLFIYDSASDDLRYELDLPSENVRTVAFNDTENYVALSSSRWDETGFFDTDRNVEVWDFATSEIAAELISNGNDGLYLPFTPSVNFLTDDTIVVYGIDVEDAWNPHQPIVYIWNWRTNVVETIDIETGAIMQMVDAEIAAINKQGDASISVQMIRLLPTVHYGSPQSYDIALGEYFETRTATQVNNHLLAIENQDGYIWIIDLEEERIVQSRSLEGFPNVLSFDHSGERLALGYQNGMIQIWDLPSDTVVTVDNVFE